MKVTQSILGSFQDCGLKAQYTIEHPPWFKLVGGSLRAVGTGYHAGCEHLYKARRDGAAGPPPLGELVAVGIESFDSETKVDSYTGQPVEKFLWDDRVPDRGTAIDFIEAMLQEYVDGVDDYGVPRVWPEDWPVVEIESRHIVDMGDFELSFACDLVLMDPVGYIVAVDNKTAGKAWPQGKEHPRKNHQSALYVAGLQRIYPDVLGHRFVFDIMQYPGKKTPPRFERRIADPGPEHIEAAVRRAREFALMWEKWHVQGGMDMQANPASTLCSPKWCDHFDGCPYGAALERSS